MKTCEAGFFLFTLNESLVHWSDVIKPRSNQKLASTAIAAETNYFVLLAK
jgi:hypothetical protein